MLLGGGLLAVFGSEAIELGGAGPLAVVAAAFVSCYFWQTQGWEVDDVSTFTYLQGKFGKCCVPSKCSKTRRSKLLSTFRIFRETQRNFIHISIGSTCFYTCVYICIYYPLISY